MSQLPRPREEVLLPGVRGGEGRKAGPWGGWASSWPVPLSLPSGQRSPGARPAPGTRDWQPVQEVPSTQQAAASGATRKDVRAKEQDAASDSGPPQSKSRRQGHKTN